VPNAVPRNIGDDDYIQTARYRHMSQSMYSGLYSTIPFSWFEIYIRDSFSKSDVAVLLIQSSVFTFNFDIVNIRHLSFRKIPHLYLLLINSVTVRAPTEVLFWHTQVLSRKRSSKKPPTLVCSLSKLKPSRQRERCGADHQTPKDYLWQDPPGYLE
jgi:hypothetical protein